MASVPPKWSRRRIIAECVSEDMAEVIDYQRGHTDGWHHHQCDAGVFVAVLERELPKWRAYMAETEELAGEPVWTEVKTWWAGNYPYYVFRRRGD